jgi:hypothetical protein
MVGDDLREVVAITWPAQDDERVRQVGPRLDAGDDDHRDVVVDGCAARSFRIVRPLMDGRFRSTSFTPQTAA